MLSAPRSGGKAASSPPWASLLRSIEARYGIERAGHVQQHLETLEALDIGGFKTYLAKLTRAVDQPNEFAGTLREGVYARMFGEASAGVVFEPHGGTGPDLSVSINGIAVNVEIKRLTEGPRPRVEPLEDWYRDEVDRNARPATREWVTSKVSNVIRGAYAQLINSELNVVILSDWSASVGRQNFLHAVEDLEGEIQSNETYGRINIVQYDPNFFLRGLKNSYLWINERSSVPLPDTVRSFFESFAAVRSQELDARIQHLIGE